MRFLQVLLTLSVLLLVSSLVVESSSSSDNNLVNYNITRGASLSSNDPRPYWLSSSGNVAFGFYRLPCTDSCSSPNWRDKYVVGIWLAKSPQQTLVWTANPNDLPLNKPSSILFTDDGKLVLRVMPDNKDKLLLPNVPEPALYAKMHDDGNFVLYGSESQIVWESFDYPTDTILGGQKLKAGIDLISSNYNYKLSTRQSDGLVAVYHLQGHHTGKILRIVSDEIEGSVSSPVTVNLDAAGNLYLVGSDDVVMKYLFRNKNQRQKKHDEGSIAEDDGVHIYRATLDSEGKFSLYKERIDGSISSTDQDEKDSSSVPVLLWPIKPYLDGVDVLIIVVFAFVLVVVMLVLCAALCPLPEPEEERRMKAEKDGDIETGKNYASVRKIPQESRRKKAEKKRTRGAYMELEKLKT